MKKSKILKVELAHVIYTLFSGIGLGIILGLSVSPVLYIVVSSIIALVVSVVSGLAGLVVEPENKISTKDDEVDNGKRKGVIKVNPLPMTTMIMGLVLGTFVGIYIRSNDLLGASPQQLVKRWNGIAGLEEDKIKRRLFDILYPPLAADLIDERHSQPAPDKDDSKGTPDDASEPDSSGSHKKGESKSAPPNPKHTAGSYNGVLFAITASDCKLLRLKHGDELRAAFKELDDKRINTYLDRCDNDKCLEALKEMICPK